MSQWILLPGALVALLVIDLLWDAWAAHEFYEKDRTDEEIRRAEHLRNARAFPLLVLAVVSHWVYEKWPDLEFLLYGSIALVLAALVYLFRAGQRTSGARTLLALLMVFTGLALFLWGAISGVVDFSPESGGFGLRGAIVVLVVAGLFWAASRLSRPASDKK